MKKIIFILFILLLCYFIYNKFVNNTKELVSYQPPSKKIIIEKFDVTINNYFGKVIVYANLLILLIFFLTLYFRDLLKKN